MIAISVLTEILTEEKRFYDTYNQAATVLRLSSDHYKYLKRELNRQEDFDHLHGMKLQIDKTKRIKIEY